jgi:hypothetical protein
MVFTGSILLSLFACTSDPAEEDFTPLYSTGEWLRNPTETRRQEQPSSFKAQQVMV